MLVLQFEAVLALEVLAVLDGTPDLLAQPIIHTSHTHTAPELILGNPFADSLFESEDWAADVQRIRLGRDRTPVLSEGRYGPLSHHRWPIAKPNGVNRQGRAQRSRF